MDKIVKINFQIIYILIIILIISINFSCKRNTNNSLKSHAIESSISNYKDKLIPIPGENIEKIYKYFQLIRLDRDAGQQLYKGLVRTYGNPEINSSQPIAKTFSMAELKKNINQGFYVWSSFNETKLYNFDLFQNYILPFQSGNSLLQDRNEVYNYILNHIPEDTLKNLSILDRYKILKNIILEPDGSPAWILSNRLGFLPNFDALQLLKYKVGTCREITDMNLYAARAVGIPIAIDFIFQWPFRPSGHSWNVIIGNDGKIIYFDGINNSNAKNIFSIPKGKVYRYTESINQELVELGRVTKGIMPHEFQYKYIIDVSNEYFEGETIKYKIVEPIKDKYAYLNLYDGNGGWTPISWAKLKGTEIEFKNVEVNQVYIISTYNGQNNPISTPFILKNSGKLAFLKPNRFHSLKKIKLDSIKPTTPDQYRNDLLKMGEIHGSNEKDFQTYQVLYKFTETNQLVSYFNEINIKNKSKFKYYRYFSPLPFKCKIGEIQFISNNEVLKGKSIYSEKEGINAVDGNLLTSFESKMNDGWIGVSLIEAKQLDKIMISAPISNPDGKMDINKNYNIFLWENGWVLFSRLKQNGNSYSIDSLPSESLFQIREEEKNFSNSRIFTINEKKNIIWF